MDELSAPVAIPATPPKASAQITSNRKKLTPSLTSLANGKTNPVEAEIQKPSEDLTSPIADKPVSGELLKQFWDEFAEQRKSQVGEYHLLKQDFEFRDNTVTIHLSNHVEEPLLQAIKGPLTEYLRQKLGNSKINIISEVQAVQSKKIAYTNKEKFDHLAEKNPILLELKERLGLDTDF